MQHQHPELDLVRSAVMMGTIGRQDTFGRYLTRSWVEESERGEPSSPLLEAVRTAFMVFSPHALRDDDLADHDVAPRRVRPCGGTAQQRGGDREAAGTIHARG